jgi:hypothetical protein
VSAINIACETDRVHVVTDGLGRGPGFTRFTAAGPEAVAGDVVPTQKIATIAHLSLAAAVRGNAAHLPVVASAIPLFGSSFDQVKSRFPSGFRPHFEAVVRQWRSIPGCRYVDQADIVVAGISEERGPQAYVVPTHARYRDCRPWIAHDAGKVFFSPNDDSLHGVFGNLPEPIDIVSFAIGTLSCQRELELFGADGESFRGSTEIGLFAQVTTITRDSIVSRIVHRWREDAVDSVEPLADGHSFGIDAAPRASGGP